MQLVSIQVGKVQTHDYNGKVWTTAYRKQPVTQPVMVNELNVEGDEQHHTNVHGGPYRAVLMYSAAHYGLWEQEIGRRLPYGSFAENFTVSDLDEDSVCLGDIYQIGDAVRLQVAQPRQPCNQIYQALGIRGIVKRVNMTFRSGWYLRVLQTGKVAPEMTIERLNRPHPDWTITRCHQIMNDRSQRPDEAGALAAIDILEPGWRRKLADAAQRA